MFNKEENLYYNGNKKLKNSGVQTKYEEWQIEEFKKCAEDPVYFIDKYVKIITLSKGLVNIKMYPFQPEFIRHMHNNKYSIAKFPRQTAKTTTAACYICWCLLFNYPSKVAVLAQKFSTAREMLSRIQKMYEELPFWMQSGVKKWNTKEIELDNNASVSAIATTMNGVRGISCITNDSVITIRDIETQEISNVSIDEYINKMGLLNSLDLTELKANPKYEILGKNGFEQFSGIIDKGLPDELLKIHFTDNTFIKCTPDHRFVVNDVEIEARNIKKNFSFGFKTVSKVEKLTDLETVYDVAMCRETNTYYANGVLNHNCNIIYLDEFAFIPNDIAEEFFKSVFPILSTGYDKAKCIITSTPRGYNHFYDRWQGAITNSNNFKPFEVSWDAVPERDQKWLDEQIKELGEQGVAQEVFCEFLGSSNLLVNTETLERLKSTAINPIRYYYDGDGKQFSPPEQDHIYLTICDTAKGGGENDYHTITVIDVTERYDYKTVFTYRNNKINDLDVPDFIVDIYKMYGGYIICESNISEQIPYILYYEHHIENLLCSGVDANISKTNTLLLYTPHQKNIGVRTDKKIKKDGCSSLKKLLEENRLQPSDIQVYTELKTYIKTNNVYNADVGKHDDMISPLVLFGWVIRQPLFESMLDELDLVAQGENSDIDLIYFTDINGKIKTLDKTYKRMDANFNFFFGNGEEDDYSDDDNSILW